MSNMHNKKSVRVRTVMGRVEFRFGFEDKCKSLAFRKDYETWSPNKQFAYERGRQFVAAFPDLIVFKTGRTVTSHAIHCYISENRKAIL